MLEYVVGPVCIKQLVTHGVTVLCVPYVTCLPRGTFVPRLFPR